MRGPVGTSKLVHSSSLGWMCFPAKNVSQKWVLPNISKTLNRKKKKKNLQKCKSSDNTPFLNFSSRPPVTRISQSCLLRRDEWWPYFRPLQILPYFSRRCLGGAFRWLENWHPPWDSPVTYQWVWPPMDSERPFLSTYYAPTLTLGSFTCCSILFI